MVKLHVHFILAILVAFACAFAPSSRECQPVPYDQFTTPTRSLIRYTETEDGALFCKRNVWQRTIDRTKHVVSSSLRFVGRFSATDKQDALSAATKRSLRKGAVRRARRAVTWAMLMLAFAASGQEAGASGFNADSNPMHEVRCVSTTATSPSVMEEMNLDGDAAVEEDESSELEEDFSFDYFDEAPLEEGPGRPSSMKPRPGMPPALGTKTKTRSKRQIMLLGVSIAIPCFIPRFLQENYRYRRDTRNVKKALVIQEAQRAEYKKSLSNTTDAEIGDELSEVKKNSTSTEDDDKPQKKKGKRKRPKGQRPSGSSKGGGPKRKPKRPKGGGGGKRRPKRSP